MDTALENRSRQGFWRGLLAGELNLSRSSLTGLMPMVATFCWFAALLLFAQISFMIYGGDKNNAEEAVCAFALMTGLHVGVMVTFYLSTLAEKDNPEFRRDPKFPFPLSLQASFAESLGIAGVLIYLIGKTLIDLGHDAAGTGPLLEQMMFLIPAMDQEKKAFLITAGALLVLSIIAAHYGFTLLRRRNGIDLDGINTFSGTQKRKEPPSLTSDDLKTQIARLSEVRERLLAQAEKAITSPPLRARLAEIDARIEALKAEIAARRGHETALPGHEARLRALSEALFNERMAFEAELAASGSTAMQRHLRRTLGLLMAAMTLIVQTLSQTGDTRREVLSEVEGLERNLAALMRERERLEDVLAERAGEGEKLAAEAAEVALRLERLNGLAEQIDETNQDWYKPQTWRVSLTPDHVIINQAPVEPQTLKRNYTLSYKPGILLLFFLATVLGVISDLLIELHPIADTSATSHVNLWVLGALLLGYMAMKFIYPIGFIGSWKAIASSADASARKARPYKGSHGLKLSAPMGTGVQSQPSLNETARVIVGNIVGLIAFDILFTVVYYQTKDNPGTIWPLIRRHAEDYHLIPFLFASAIFICVLAPLWVYIWERYSRWSSRTPGSAERPLTWVALVLTFIGTLCAGVFLAGMLGTAVWNWWNGDPQTAPATQAEPARQAEVQSQLRCDFDQHETSGAVMLTAWKYADVERVELDIKQGKPPCTIVITKDKTTNFVAVLGAASEEGKPVTEFERAARRAEVAQNLIDKADMKARNITVYTWVLGQHSGLKSRSPNFTGEDTRWQRPLIIISGHVENPNDPEAVKAQIKAALAHKLGMNEDEAKLKDLTFTNPDNKPKAVSAP